MSDGHRHTMGPEHDFEPQHGLPQALPAGERLLWQGAPDFRSVALHVFHVRKLAIYFALMLLVRLGFDIQGGAAAADLAMAALRFGGLACLAVALMLGLAWLTARTTAYTLTDRRVVMRIGIVLSVSFNLPLARISAAALKLHADGTGNLPLALMAPDKIAFLHLWPHARGWRLTRPEPMLLCVPDAQSLAARLGEAWSEAHSRANGPAAAGVGGRSHPASPSEPQRTPITGLPARSGSTPGWVGTGSRVLARVLPRLGGRLPTH